MAAWAVISAPIIETMRQAGWGLFILGALKAKIVSFVCFTFADNTNIVHTAKNVNTKGKHVLSEMKNVIDTWEGGLKPTGGAIIPNKATGT